MCGELARFFASRGGGLGAEGPGAGKDAAAAVEGEGLVAHGFDLRGVDRWLVG